MEKINFWHEKANRDVIHSGLSMIFIVVIIALLFNTCENRSALASQTAMYKAMSDSLVTYKTSDSLFRAEKKIVQTSKPEDFIKAKTNDPEIIALQKLVKQYKKELGKQGSVAILKSEVNIDTSYTKSIIPNKAFVWKDSIHNKWITWDYSIKDTIKDNVKFKLKIISEYSIIYKEKSNGWFKKPTPYAEVTNYNTYGSTASLNVYRVATEVKSKRISIGPGLYYGIGPNFTFQTFVGAGIQYSLFRF